jgi:hypothetical protein
MAGSEEIHARAAAIVEEARREEEERRAVRTRLERLEREVVIAWFLHSGQVTNYTMAHQMMLREAAWAPGWHALVGKAYHYFDLKILEEENG